MAVIGKIRRQSGLLIILVGFAMLLFILGDIFSSGTNTLFGGSEASIGSINGQAIPQQEFEVRVQRELDERYGPEGSNEEARESVRNAVWQQIVQEETLEKEYEKLGLNVSPDELLDQVKNTAPGSVLYQYFTNPQTGQLYDQFRDPQTGGLNSNMVMQAIQNILNSENAKDWLPIEEAIKADRKFNKYSTLISKGLYATSLEARNNIASTGMTVDFNFVGKEYSTIEDDAVTVTDADLKAYYDTHKNEARFEQPRETRSIKYVEFSVQPSAEDLMAIRDELTQLSAMFAADSNDTIFVQENSDYSGEISIGYVPAEGINPAVRDSIINAPIGTVVGPFDDGEYMVISKKSGMEMQSDSVRARHILISVQDGDTAKLSAAKSKVDSLKSEIEKNKNFEALAREFSEDFGSAEKGGDLDFFGRGVMVPQFEEKAFSSEVGEMSVAITQFGVHLIQVTDKTKEKPNYLLSNVQRLIEPSKTTYDLAYNNASKFSIANKEGDSFETNGEEQGIKEANALTPSVKMLGPLGENSEMSRWLFSAEKGDVSVPIEFEDKFVVAKVSGIRPKGVLPFEAVKSEIESEVLKEKKAEKIMSDLGSYTSLDEAASALGATIKTASGVSFSMSSLPQGLGRELDVLGKVFALEAGQTSKPIKGSRGVYVVQVNSVQPANLEVDLVPAKSDLELRYSSRAEREAYPALQKIAKVEDERGRVY